MGTGYGSLVQLGRTDYQFWHELQFDAVAGQTYLVVADTGPYGGGQLRVAWSQYADRAKPTGQVAIDGGAGSTSQRMVTLTLADTDNVGVSGVLISNSPMLDDRYGDPGLQHGLMHAEWLDGNPSTVRWSLTDLVRGGDNGSGTKTVYVQWQDAQGNLSAVVSDSIVANLPPVGASTVQPTRIVFTRSWSTTGTHTVTVRVNGTAGRPRAEVDAFVLLR